MRKLLNMCFVQILESASGICLACQVYPERVHSTSGLIIKLWGFVYPRDTPMISAALMGPGHRNSNPTRPYFPRK